MESNPGTFFVSVERIKPPIEDDTISIVLSLGDARRLHSILTYRLPGNEHNSVWSLKLRLTKALEEHEVSCNDLGLVK
jgi:hypothetical protein